MRFKNIYMHYEIEYKEYFALVVLQYGHVIIDTPMGEDCDMYRKHMLTYNYQGEFFMYHSGSYKGTATSFGIPDYNNLSTEELFQQSTLNLFPYELEHIARIQEKMIDNLDNTRRVVNINVL